MPKGKRSDAFLHPAIRRIVPLWLPPAVELALAQQDYKLEMRIPGDDRSQLSPSSRLVYRLGLFVGTRLPVLYSWFLSLPFIPTPTTNVSASAPRTGFPWKYTVALSLA
ncbi:hypothetical protein Pan181_37080 [Aeoliella mucimassa]|uniref:Uncharacterized protein n=1 Tax=Aeoliella mucimassa TaxID=2527972 RepID=A0A518ARZ1_9BACT|nr:hypothetical protein Pan181_37080 [Aeoliella mucimassa]